MTQTSKRYQNRQTLKHLYHERDLTIREVAEELECGSSTVSRYVKRFGLEKTKPVPLVHTDDGYEMWRDYSEGGGNVLVHRLAAVAWFGFDAVRGKHVHHRDPEGLGRRGVPWDNREEVLEVIDPSEHMQLHGREYAPPAELLALGQKLGLTYREIEDSTGISKSVAHRWTTRFGFGA